MKFLGENAARLELAKRSLSSDMVEVVFSCEWCSGKFEFFSDAENFQKLERLCQAIIVGKGTGSWLSEEGDLELKFSRQNSGKVRTSVICYPTVRLTYPGRLEFEIDLDLSSFETFA